MSKQAAATATGEPRQHGVNGVYYGGDWLDIEDCAGKFTNIEEKCSGCRHQHAATAGTATAAGGACPRSASRNVGTVGKPALASDKSRQVLQYDVLIVGAGCIGAAVARELSRYKDLDVLWVDAADDVAQGATKGNSGIVHAGYDDTPGTNRAKYCWTGNQMFAQLDRELRFGYQENGSLVVAFNQQEVEILKELKHRGETNGVQRLKIIGKSELQRMEPYIHPDAIAALYSPDAGNVIPYEYNIALAENAIDNGVELRNRVSENDVVFLLYSSTLTAQTHMSSYRSNNSASYARFCRWMPMTKTIFVRIRFGKWK
jgi:glycerol-3-phosphate dehydrogenase